MTAPMRSSPTRTRSRSVAAGPAGRVRYPGPLHRPVADAGHRPGRRGGATPEFGQPGRSGTLAGRGVRPAHRDVDIDLGACEADIRAWLLYNGARYGPWVHGDTFWAFLWAPRAGHGVRRGDHGVGPGPRARGAAQLVRAGREAGPGGRRLDRRGLDDLGHGVSPDRAAPLRLGGARARRAAASSCTPSIRGPGRPPWRPTPTGPGCSRAWPSSSAGPSGCGRPWPTGTGPTPGRAVTTDGLAAHLAAWSGIDISPWWARYVHGRE